MPAVAHPKNSAKSTALVRSELENGRDELNMATYPLGAMLRNCPIQKEVKTDKNGDEEVLYHKMITFQRRDPKRKTMVPATIKVTTTSRNGFPNQEDEENLLTFICHAVNSDQLDSMRLKYNRDDLFELRSHSDAGKNYASLDSTVERYYKADFEFINAWFDSESGEYLDRFSLKIISERGIHRKKPGQRSPTSFFTWAPSFHKILQSTNLKALNLDCMFGLPRGATRYAYRFLDKRFCRGRFPEVAFEMEELARHCGLSLGQASWKLKQTIQRILADLQEELFIDSFAFEPMYQGGKREKGKWRVRVKKATSAHSCPETSKALEIAQLFLTDVLQKCFGVKRSEVKPSEVAHAAKLLNKHGPLDPRLFVKAARRQLKVTAPNARMFQAVDWYLDEILKIYADLVASQASTIAFSKKEQVLGGPPHDPGATTHNPELRNRAKQIWDNLSSVEQDHRKKTQQAKYSSPATRLNSTLLENDCIFAIMQELKKQPTNEIPENAP